MSFTSLFKRFISLFNNKTTTLEPISKNAFDNMSAEDKRVAIAIDVIANIDSKRVRPVKGTYVDFKKDIGLKDPELQDKEVNEVIRDKTCYSCALGSMFICAIDKFDRLKVGESGARQSSNSNGDGFGLSAVYNYLGRFFSVDQLAAMETAFEGSSFLNAPRDEELYRRSTLFCKGIVDPTERLKKIMSNVIFNNGTFIP